MVSDNRISSIRRLPKQTFDVISSSVCHA